MELAEAEARRLEKVRIPGWSTVIISQQGRDGEIAPM